MSLPPDPEPVPVPDPSSSAELTPPTNARRVIAGVAVPVAAIWSWILSEATHDRLWYGLLVVVAVLAGALYASGSRDGRLRRRPSEGNS
jgi:hypothetical protein